MDEDYETERIGGKPHKCGLGKETHRDEGRGPELRMSDRKGKNTYRSREFWYQRH